MILVLFKLRSYFHCLQTTMIIIYSSIQAFIVWPATATPSILSIDLIFSPTNQATVFVFFWHCSLYTEVCIPDIDEHAHWFCELEMSMTNCLMPFLFVTEVMDSNLGRDVWQTFSLRSLGTIVWAKEFMPSMMLFCSSVEQDWVHMGRSEVQWGRFYRLLSPLMKRIDTKFTALGAERI